MKKESHAVKIAVERTAKTGEKHVVVFEKNKFGIKQNNFHVVKETK